MTNKFFEGWYFKHQTNSPVNKKTLAVIPGRAANSAFVLVVTDNNSYHIPYPLSEYKNQGGYICVGDNTFSHGGASLNICTAGLNLVGDIGYGELSPINGDIMGPFKFFPMECRHGVISMRHSLRGAIVMNGEKLDFGGGNGYIESDSGRSFPKWYAWVQCNAFERDCSIMASVARIPFYGLRFWGCIAVVWLEGREYRLATYKGVKIQHCEPGTIVLTQGKYRLEIYTNQQIGHALPAPSNGKMSRTIRETVSCNAQFRFTKRDVCLFDESSNFASCEYQLSI